MSSVLVTGATGFIGRHTLNKLCKEFDHVYAAYIKEKISTNHENITWLETDLLSAKQVENLFKKISPTHLLHLAWYTEHGKYGHSEKNIDWLSASLHLIRTFREHGGQRVVCAGTCFEYDLDYGFLSEKLTPLTPELMYGVSKKSLYNTVSAYANLTGLSSAWGRVFYLYGPFENPSRLVASVSRSLLQNQSAKCSSGDQKKDFLHVYDVADAFVKIIKSDIQGAVNIGSGQGVPVKNIVLKIGEITGKQDLIEIGALPSRKNEKPLIQADNRRLLNELQWQPGFTLDEGLKHTVEWWADYLSSETLKNAI